MCLFKKIIMAKRQPTLSTLFLNKQREIRFTEWFMETAKARISQLTERDDLKSIQISVTPKEFRENWTTLESTMTNIAKEEGLDYLASVGVKASGCDCGNLKGCYSCDIIISFGPKQ